MRRSCAATFLCVPCCKSLPSLLALAMLSAKFASRGFIMPYERGWLYMLLSGEVPQWLARPLQQAVCGPLDAPGLSLPGTAGAVAAGPTSIGRPASTLRYLEIGTQTYDTLSDGEPGPGASVDLMAEYLDALQKRAPGGGEGKVFLTAAVVDTPAAGDVSVFVTKSRYVEDTGVSGLRGECTNSSASRVRRELRGMGLTINTPSGCLPWYTLGMHSVDRPFYAAYPYLVSPAQKAQLLVEKRRVRGLTPGELLGLLNASNVELLKIDTEGFDFKIIAAFATHMASHPAFRPTNISWECKHLALCEFHRGLAMMQHFGYSCRMTSVESCGCALQPELLEGEFFAAGPNPLPV